MKDFGLANIRMLLREHKKTLSEHRLVTSGKSPMPLGIWLNIPKLRATSEDDLAQMFVELIEWVKR